jgi:hypothetical protein
MARATSGWISCRNRVHRMYAYSLSLSLSLARAHPPPLPPPLPLSPTHRLIHPPLSLSPPHVLTHSHSLSLSATHFYPALGVMAGGEINPDTGLFCLYIVGLFFLYSRSLLPLQCDGRGRDQSGHRHTSVSICC